MTSIWKKRNKVLRDLDKFAIVEVFVDIGAIPAGIYRVREVTETGFVCGFDKVCFGVYCGGENLYQYRRANGKFSLTSRSKFIEKYWLNYQQKKNIRNLVPINGFNALSFCKFDPALRAMLAEINERD